ncbi:hypothetical protein [Desulfovibrio ferrophilus]|uniref:Uncharacterized protein n=1 Tax=Desulfovibrio ferrophilus TaxID=241368 RepID=A0A2Z6AZB6_9BACT|nr:hypothetical protein [Desulfovibrio ferrophilus]BBD08496.1 uncharacterized protein DFE_1770 [Desulfovibrio ferrophilus]
MIKEIAFTIVMLLCSVPVIASDLPEITQTMKLYEGVLTFPPPLWINDVKELGGSIYHREQRGNLFTLEQIPKGQEFDSWTQLHGVYGYYLPEYDMDRFLRESIGALVVGCKVEPKMGVARNDKGDIMLSYRCDELQDELVKNGNNAERAIVFASQVRQSFAKVYQSWRGATETLEKLTFTKSVIEEATKRTQAIRFFGAQPKE